MVRDDVLRRTVLNSPVSCVVKTIKAKPLRDRDRDRAASADATYYRALIHADASQINAGQKVLEVLPGMTGTVEIRTGERSVLSFMLRPMLKSREAFTER